MSVANVSFSNVIMYNNLDLKRIDDEIKLKLIIDHVILFRSLNHFR